MLVAILESARRHTDALKAIEGWRWEPREDQTSFADLVLFSERELRIMPKQ